jgi:ComF family protein
VGKAADALASLFFPAPCRICESPLLMASRIPICRECLHALQPLSGPMCEVCGRPFVSEEAGLVARPRCGYCRRGVYHFDAARSYGAYDEAMVRAITLLKYSGVVPLGGWFAARREELVARELKLLLADVVVPVPLHPSRLHERGYNQAELIARPLARRLKLPCRTYLLVRTRPRPNKLKLTRHERWETVRGAYATREGTRVDNLRILLVDDVFTTGATLDACARALRTAGTARVLGLTVARVVPDAWQTSLAREVVLEEPSGDPPK